MAKIQLDNIPRGLKDTALWCCWRYQVRAGSDKPTKVPYNPLTGKGAQSNDRSTFARFGQALMAMEMNSYDGLGVGIFDDLCVIDLDHCIDEMGTFSDLSSEIFACMNTYAEISPGGDGVHLYFRAPGLVYDKERFYIKNPKNGIEIYVAGATNRFITVTGNALTNAGINNRTEQLQNLLERFMRREVRQKRTSNNSFPDMPTMQLSMDDEKLIRAARLAKNGALFMRLFDGDTSGYKSQNEADLALCNILAFWTSKDIAQMDRLFRRSGLMRPKWDERRGITTYGMMTLQNAIDQMGRTYSDCLAERIMGRGQPMPSMAPRGGGFNGNR